MYNFDADTDALLVVKYVFPVSATRVNGIV